MYTTFNKMRVEITLTISLIYICIIRTCLKKIHGFSIGEKICIVYNAIHSTLTVQNIDNWKKIV